HHNVLEAALNNDFVAARKHMDKLLPLLRNMESGGYTQKVKLGCELRGIPVGNPRQPLLPLSAEDRAEFEKIFKNL
ncbi:MAG: dihydrodipicolinate synthase family protein, partial [Anaerolineales bacterium]|nr:dihydrodipicolinate synthase family protein [Anaerolineales bacterium]